MRRRDFLTQSSKSVLASALLPLEAVPVLAGQASRESRATRIPVARLAAELARQIPEWLRQANVPGLSIAVIQDARLAWRRAFGVRDASSNVQVDNDTLFEAASMSKPVFAYVVLKLCETGVMDLDTPLTKYVSTRFLEGDPRLDLMTARHVLSHTGGFQNWRSEKSPLAIHFTPGSRYLYSGEGYNYLQTVVTTLLGQPFERYMRSRLFEPFGMTSSCYVWNDAVGRRMAQPHDPDRKTDRQQQVHGVVRRAVRVRGRASLHTFRLREVRRRRDRSEAGHCLSAETGQRQRDAPSPREARGGPISRVMGARLAGVSQPGSGLHLSRRRQRGVSLFRRCVSRRKVRLRGDDQRREWIVGVDQPAHVRLTQKFLAG